MRVAERDANSDRVRAREGRPERRVGRRHARDARVDRSARSRKRVGVELAVPEGETGTDARQVCAVRRTLDQYWKVAQLRERGYVNLRIDKGGASAALPRVLHDGVVEPPRFTRRQDPLARFTDQAGQEIALPAVAGSRWRVTIVVSASAPRESRGDPPRIREEWGRRERSRERAETDLSRRDMSPNHGFAGLGLLLLQACRRRQRPLSSSRSPRRHLVPLRRRPTLLLLLLLLLLLAGLDHLGGSDPPLGTGGQFLGRSDAHPPR